MVYFDWKRWDNISQNNKYWGDANQFQKDQMNNVISAKCFQLISVPFFIIDLYCKGNAMERGSNTMDVAIITPVIPIKSNKKKESGIFINAEIINTFICKLVFEILLRK